MRKGLAASHFSKQCVREEMLAHLPRTFRSAGRQDHGDSFRPTTSVSSLNVAYDTRNPPLSEHPFTTRLYETAFRFTPISRGFLTGRELLSCGLIQSAFQPSVERRLDEFRRDETDRDNSSNHRQIMPWQRLKPQNTGYGQPRGVKEMLRFRDLKPKPNHFDARGVPFATSLSGCTVSEQPDHCLDSIERRDPVGRDGTYSLDSAPRR